MVTPSLRTLASLLVLVVAPACAAVLGVRELVPDGAVDAGADDDVADDDDDDDAPRVPTDGATPPRDASSPGDAAVVDASCGTDLTENPDHCGRCDHSCGGGACVGSVCQPVVLASGQGVVGSLASDATHVYVSSLDNQTISRVAKSGGAVTVLAGAPNVDLAKHIAVDGTHVYWANSDCCDNTVARCPVTGCVGAGAPPVEVLAVGSEPLGIAVDGTHVYWADRNAALIERAWLDGGAREVVAVSQGALPVAVAVAGGVAYWLGDFNGRVWRGNVPPDGGVPLGANGQLGRDLALDPTHVYWGAAIDVGDPGRISRVARDGSGTVETIGVAQGDPLTILVDGSTVYWTAQREPDAGAATGGVYACDVTGCPGTGPRVVAAGQDRPRGLAIDANAIYWGSAGFVWKLVKP